MTTVLHWFRQDLRLSDNPALYQAAQVGDVVPVYIHSPSSEHRPLGAASRVWLHHSLESLDQSLDGKLNCYVGDPVSILKEIVQRLKPEAVYWNRCYGSGQSEIDADIQSLLKRLGVASMCRHETMLWEPEITLKSDGTPYKVFTPFYKNCLANTPPRACYEVPKKSTYIRDAKCRSLEELDLLPKHNWWKDIIKRWEVGEASAHKKLTRFIQSGLNGYKDKRHYPSKANTSKLSMHLHFGEISPHQVWWATESCSSVDAEYFRSEIGWREFSVMLLHYFPSLPRENFNKKYDVFPWRDNPEWLRAWQQGRTGIPIVDAGMRELWQTGSMHNRVRMIVASFLVKNLNIDWRQGEAWFWDCLFDADLANNSASWQWVAGCGVDAAPYFRVFNPVSQGQKFDGEGVYTKTYVPELEKLPSKYLFSPWEAPQDVLEKAGIVLGETYPKPLVDLKLSRLQALENYASLEA